MRMNVTEGSSAQVPILLGGDFISSKQLDMMHDGTIQYTDRTGKRRKIKIGSSGSVPLLSLVGSRHHPTQPLRKQHKDPLATLNSWLAADPFAFMVEDLDGESFFGLYESEAAWQADL